MHIPPRRLVFSGGGIRTVSYLGVLEVLQEKGLLKNLREVCGVSAGALTACMVALGYSLEVISRFVFLYDFGNIRSIEPEDAFDYMEQFGLDNGENLQALVKKILYYKGFPPHATFQDVANQPWCKSLRIWASDIQHMKPIEFSVRTTPTMPIVTALHASMAIPMYFIPVKHPEDGRLLVDGALYDNYPISFLTEEELHSTIGVTFEFSSTPLPIPDFTTFLTVITASNTTPVYKQIAERYKHQTICIPTGEYPAMNFEASLDDRKRLVEMGRQATRQFYNQTQSPILPMFNRRHSVS